MLRRLNAANSNEVDLSVFYLFIFAMLTMFDGSFINFSQSLALQVILAWLKAHCFCLNLRLTELFIHGVCFLLVLNLDGMFLFIALLIPSLNCDWSSLADLFAFTGDAISSLISLRSLFKSSTLVFLYTNTFLRFCFIQVWFC